MTALGVATAYLHDTGMVDMTRSGRRLHGIRAAQDAFGPDVDGLVRHLLEPGPIRGRLDEVDAAAPFAVPLELVVRELLSLSVIHGKSLVPAAVIDDRRELRRLLQRFAFIDLAGCGRRAAPGRGRASPVSFDVNTDRYVDANGRLSRGSRSRGPQAELAETPSTHRACCGRPTCSASAAPCSGRRAASRYAWTPRRRTPCARCVPQPVTRPT